MKVHSCGILPYKFIDGDCYVFMGHPGGPYNRNKDIWGFPKGEMEEGESEKDCAVREFREETGFNVDRSNLNLKYTSNGSNKIITLFLANMQLDPSNATCNTTTIEYPKDSGKYITFPENDRYSWFSLKEAESKIFKNQLSILQAFSRYVNES